MRDIIHKALCQYNMTNAVCKDAPDVPYPLIDLVSPPGGSLGQGEDELFKLADFIAGAIAGGSL
jgi:hypothetical protein